MKALLERLGLPGIVGLGLLLFGMSFYFGTVAESEDALGTLARERNTLQRTIRSASDGAPGAALALADVPELLRRIDALAQQNGISAGRASYQLKTAEGSRRLEINLPVQAGYPAIRTYLRDILALTPDAALDDLSLQRPQATEPKVEAQLRISFPLARTP